ncbi:LOW QUALITY PROTEIN: ropporin-1-like protein [Augochlora pura]
MTFEFACDISNRSPSRCQSTSPPVSNMSDDVLYCAEQIKIPPTYPEILKVFMKAAIRTQPYDLLRWTCAYFRALANGDLPPIKNRLEYPPFVHPTNITPGYLRTLLNTFGPIETVGMEALLEKWQGIALPETSLYQILLVGQLTTERECNFFKFLAIACGFLGKVSRLARE